MRIPAALNDVSALRPTYGLVSNRGTFPISASLDTVGPMARAIEDVAHVLAAIAGYDRDDPWAIEHAYEDPLAWLDAGVAGRVRIGLPTTLLLRRRRARHRAQRAGRGGRRARRPRRRAARGRRARAPTDAVGVATQLIRAEALALHRERLDADPGRFGEDVRRRLELGTRSPGADVAAALDRMRDWRVRMLRVFDDEHPQQYQPPQAGAQGGIIQQPYQNPGVPPPPANYGSGGSAMQPDPTKPQY